MESLYLLIPLSVALVFGALWLFFKASDDGQFDDMVGPAIRVLQDDDRI
jgi:cbb3-type cytochrome oxidase maturation protein